ASWAGQFSGNDRSAGKRRSGGQPPRLQVARHPHRGSARRHAPTASTSAPSTSDYGPAAATGARSAPSNTRSSAPAGTCSQAASSSGHFPSAAAGETGRCEDAEESEDAGAPEKTEHYPVGGGVADAGRISPAQHQAANGVDEHGDGLIGGEPVQPAGH